MSPEILFFISVWFWAFFVLTLPASTFSNKLFTNIGLVAFFLGAATLLISSAWYIFQKAGWL